MANKYGNRKDIYILASAVLLLFVAFTFIFHLPAHATREEFIYTDAKTYIRAAHSLYRDHLFADPIRPFGYPVVIGIPYIFGDVSREAIVAWGVVVNLLFFLGSTFLLYDILSQILKKSRGTLALTLVFVLSLSNVLMTYQLMTETIFVFLILLCLNQLLKFIDTGKQKNMFFSLAALCYSVTVRPIGFYFALLAIMLCIIYFVRTKKFSGIAYVIAIYMLTIGLQSLNMYRIYGSYTVSFIQNITLHNYIVNKASYLKEGRPGTFGSYSEKYINEFDSLIALKASPENTVAYWQVADPMHKQAVKNFMPSGKNYILKAYGFNMMENTRIGNQMFSFYNPEEQKWIGIKIVQKLTFFQNVVFTLLLIFISLIVTLLLFVKGNYKVPRYWFVTATTAIAMYCLLVSGISHWQGDRFNFICYPFTIIIVSYFIYYMRNKKEAAPALAGNN